MFPTKLNKEVLRRMVDSLRRIVWLTYEQRLSALAAANRVAESTESREIRHTMKVLVYELTSGFYAPYFPRSQIALTIIGLSLPKDSLPVRMSDNEVQILSKYGDLPLEIQQVGIPPNVFYHANGIEETHYE